MRVEFLLIFCIFSATFLYGQEDITSDQIIVRSFESGGLNPSQIIISYGDEKVEEVDIKGFNSSKNWKKNINTLNTVLNRIRKQGYTLINSVSSGNPSYFVSTYIYLRNDLIVERTKE